jgi:hypothetical protein
VPDTYALSKLDEGTLDMIRGALPRFRVRRPLALDPLVNFFPVDRNRLGRGNPNADLVPVHTENGDCDIITDHQGFSGLARQNKHVRPRSMEIE